MICIYIVVPQVGNFKLFRNVFFGTERYVLLVITDVYLSHKRFLAMVGVRDWETCQVTKVMPFGLFVDIGASLGTQIFRQPEICERYGHSKYCDLWFSEDL